MMRSRPKFVIAIYKGLKDISEFRTSTFVLQNPKLSLPPVRHNTDLPVAEKY